MNKFMHKFQNLKFMENDQVEALYSNLYITVLYVYQ